ncbi:MAG: tetratricopeptide repeat protein, partial [Anaerolineales bacterium]
MRRPATALLALTGLLAAVVACYAPADLARSPLTSPEPTVYPSPTPTSTPSPPLLLPSAARAMHNGDYVSAASLYHQALAAPLDPIAAAQAQLGLGTAYLRGGQYENSAIALQALLTDHPDSELAPQAQFLLADALAGLGDPIAESDEYTAYLSAGTVITPYLNRWIGQALHQGADYEGAANAYALAAADAPSVSFEATVREELALAYVAMEEHAAAVAQYDAILSLADAPARNARIEYQAGQTLALVGDDQAAYARYRSAVDLYPTEDYAYLSLVELVDAGEPVDDRQRGLVDFHARAYSPAVQAFYRYVDTYPQTHLADAHWYTGLSFLYAGSPALAQGEFQILLDTHPD